MLFAILAETTRYLREWGRVWRQQVPFWRLIRQARATTERQKLCGIWQNFPNHLSEFHEPCEIRRLLEVPISTQPESFYYVLGGIGRSKDDDRSRSASWDIPQTLQYLDSAMTR